MVTTETETTGGEEMELRRVGTPAEPLTDEEMEQYRPFIREAVKSMVESLMGRISLARAETGR